MGDNRFARDLNFLASALFFALLLLLCLAGLCQVLEWCR